MRFRAIIITIIIVIFAKLAHLLIPQESNNHKAKILHHSSLSLIIGFFLFSQLILSVILAAKPSVLGFASQISPERVVELTNIERAKYNLEPLKLNSTLSASAQRKAGDMFAFNYWAHNSPSGRSPWTFFQEVGYKFIYAGENLARDFPSAEEAMSAWMASPTHRENILNPKYKEIGISVVDGTLGGTETTLIVSHFGTVAASPAVASNKTENQISPVKQVQAQTEEKIVQAPIPTEAPNQPVLAREIGGESLTNPFTVTKTFSFGMILVLGLAIAIDGFIIYKRKTFRLSGRSLAHVLFLTGIIVIILFSAQGLII